MLTVMTCLWGTKYTPDHVNRLYSMLARNLTFDRFVLLCDRQNHKALDLCSIEIEVMPMPTLHSEMGGCLRRLPVFTSEYSFIGDRVLSCDLDTVVFNNIDHLMTGTHPFRMWKCPSLGPHGFAYGPGLCLYRPGVFDGLYEQFCDNPQRTLQEAKNAKWTGTDQAIINHYISNNRISSLIGWDHSVGVYSYRDHIAHSGKKPPNISILGFYGAKYDPMTCNLDWVREAYR